MRRRESPFRLRPRVQDAAGRRRPALHVVRDDRSGRDDGRGADGRNGRGDLRSGAAADEQRLQAGEDVAEIERACDPALPRRRRLLQPAGQRAPGPEDQRLDGSLRELELCRDLAIRQPLPLAEEDRAPLRLRQLLEHVLEPDQLVGTMRGRRSKLLDDLEVGRRFDPAAPPGGAAAREADVVRDLEEPGRLDLRHDAALDAAERVQEGGLHRVLGLLTGAELVQAVPEDLVGVLLVERARRVGFRRRGPFDPACTTYRR